MTSLTPGGADYCWRQWPRSRRRLLMAVSLLTAGCLFVGDGLAQEPPRFPSRAWPARSPCRFQVRNGYVAGRARLTRR